MSSQGYGQSTIALKRIHQREEKRCSLLRHIFSNLGT
jgi:hypothetical protein